ncbi:MAG: leucine-rich repeat protein [Candidatus Kariarchaeaceae archaeon]|jgi:hypothetical protein
MGDLQKILKELNVSQYSSKIIDSRWTQVVNGNIISLDLGRTELTRISKDILSNLSSLKYLYLHGNQLQNLPTIFLEELPNLNGLNLPNNLLEEITDESFGKNRNVKWINLAANRIGHLSLGCLNQLPNLQSLRLSFNQINRIPKGLFIQQHRLRDLYLDHNLIDELSDETFTGLSKLQKLNISSNHLSIINSNVFTDIKELLELNVSFNVIRSFSITNLHELRFINLTGNQLDNYPQSLTTMSHVQNIKIDNNPFTSNTNSVNFDTIDLETLTSYLREEWTGDSVVNDHLDVAKTNIDSRNLLVEYDLDEFIDLFNQLLNDPRFDGGVGKVSNVSLAKRSGKVIEEVARITESLVLQERIKGIRHEDSGTPMTVIDDYWVIMQPTTQKGSKTYLHKGNFCLMCQNEVDNIFDACPNCSLRCEICKLAIKLGDDWDTCSSRSSEACHKIFHRNEYIEWVKVYNQCPSCKSTIDLNLYDLTKQHSDKISSLVVQDLAINEDSEYDATAFVLPIAVYTVNVLSQIYEEITVTKQIVQDFESSVVKNHEKILTELQPLTKEIVLLKTFATSLDQKILTKQGFLDAVEEIISKFDHIENNLGLLVSVHKKDKKRLEKVKKTALGKSDQVSVDALVERSGMKNRILSYVKKPNLKDLRSIMSSIKNGIKNKTGDPFSWIKLSTMFMV